LRGWLDPWMGPLLLAVGGGFIYIAAVDLIPETHHDTARIRSVLHLLLFGLGVLLMFLVDRLI